MLSVEVKEYTLSQYNQKEILRYCGIKSADEGFSAILQACQEEANEVVSARVCYAVLPVRVEKPALQNADMEWNTEKKISSTRFIPSVPWTVAQIAKAPIASMPIVKPKI